ncbi:MAG: hypothetical protein ACI4DU_01425 [Lachnospiraceae bacterium]
MHIKHIHETLERLSEIACEETSKSVECINTCELGAVTDMIKDLAEAEYHAYIAKAMKEEVEEEEAEEKYILKELKEEYGEEEGKRYYDMWRYKSGRFAPKGRGMRRGYVEPPYYHMTPDMYREHDPEYWRDMDKHTKGVMYYTEPITMESRYDKAKRGYEESKMTHKENTPEHKQAKLKELEMYLKELSEDVTQLIADATPEERAMVKNKMQVLTQKIV